MQQKSSIYQQHHYKAACQKHLKFFIQEAFPVVNPSVKFIDNWHIDLITEYLESLAKNQIKRLIINIPPRFMKSICVSVCWPAWLLGNDSAKRIICASYSQHLSDKLSLDCRHLMSSEFFAKIFPNTIISKDQNQKNKFLTKKRGFRLATSVGGTITGEGGDFLILDDPHNAIDVNSSKKREKTINWFQQSFSSRLDNRKTGVIVVVMQRLHVKDLVGSLLEKSSDNWHVLDIPAIAPKDTYYEFNKFYYCFPEKQLLHPERCNEDEMNILKKELGNYVFSAQYLQDPIAEDSSMIKRSWLKYFIEILPLDSYEHIIQSWDTAIKSGDGNSYTVCTTWGKIDENFYLLDILRDRMEYPDLKNAVISKTTSWNPDLIMIEDKASGQSLIQDLKREYKQFSVMAVKPKGDKFTRFARVSPLFEQGQILLFKNAGWLMDYERELLSFPNGAHDDQVDSTSQYLSYIITNHLNKYPNIRSL